MTYTVIYENPLQNTTPDVNVNYDSNVFVTYDNTLEQFRVNPTEKGSEYTVARGELVRDTCKYTCEVIDVILSRLPEKGNYLVYLSNIALNSINLVCDGNRLLF